MHQVSEFTYYRSASAYIAAHRERHDRLLSADHSHYLASYPAYISDILHGLPSTPAAHNLRELYAFQKDEGKNVEMANRLIAAVLRLPIEQKPRRVSRAFHGTPSRYNRKPGDPSITEYKCMMHRMDNHVQGDEKCKRISNRRSFTKSHSTPSAAALIHDTAFIDAVAGSIAFMIARHDNSSSSTSNPDVNPTS